MSPTRTRTADQHAHARRMMLAISLSLLAWLLYLNALQNPFVLDDFRLIVENATLGNLHDLRAIVMHDITRPLVNLTYAVDVALWGRRPLGLHATNVLLHACNVFLVFWVARLLALDRRIRCDTSAIPPSQPPHRRADGPSGSSAPFLTRAGSGPRADVVAVSTAALFALHPMLTQAVGYVSGRSELLYVTCFLMAFLCARQYSIRGGGRWLACTFVLWAVALMAKEVAGMFPFVWLAYDVLLLRDVAPGLRQRLLRVHLPVIAAALIAVGVRIWVLLAVEYPNQSLDGGLVLPALDAPRQYLLLFLGQSRQAIFHAVPPIDTLSVPAAWLALGTLAGAGVFAWRMYRFDPLITFGVVWFGLLLVPSSALFVLGRGEAVAEHRAYGASLGIFLVFGSAVAWLTPRMATRPLKTRLWYAGLILMVAGLSGRTFVRNAIWSNPFALWTEAIELAPNHWLPRMMLAESLRQAGRCEEAIGPYRTTIEIYPEADEAYTKLGACLLSLNRIDEATRAFSTLHMRAPASADGSLGLAAVSVTRGDLIAAHAYLNEAIQRDPSNVSAREMLAIVEAPARPDEVRRLCAEIQRLAPAPGGTEACVNRIDAAVPHGGS